MLWSAPTPSITCGAPSERRRSPRWRGSSSREGSSCCSIIRVDWKTWLVSPLLAHHPSQDPEPWRVWLRENGFSLEEEGTQFSTLYFLAKKQKGPND